MLITALLSSVEEATMRSHLPRANAQKHPTDHTVKEPLKDQEAVILQVPQVPAIKTDTPKDTDNTAPLTDNTP